MRIKNFISHGMLKLLGSSVAMMALMITTLSVNSACYFNAHQPELPKSAQKLRKF